MAKMMQLKDAVNYFKEYMTNAQLGKLLGVSPDQVYKYSVGYTATCNSDVVDAFYDNLEVDGEPVLIDYFENKAQYLAMRRLKEKADATETTSD